MHKDVPPFFECFYMICLLVLQTSGCRVFGRGETGRKQESNAVITLPGIPDGLRNCNPWGVTERSSLGYRAN